MKPFTVNNFKMMEDLGKGEGDDSDDDNRGVLGNLKFRDYKLLKLQDIFLGFYVGSSSSRVWITNKYHGRMTFEVDCEEHSFGQFLEIREDREDYKNHRIKLEPKRMDLERVWLK
jgi:hypothetical protein